VHVFGHEADPDVKENLSDTGCGQWRLQEGREGLEDTRQLPGELGWSLDQHRMQQAYGTLKICVQLQEDEEGQTVGQRGGDNMLQPPQQRTVPAALR